MDPVRRILGGSRSLTDKAEKLDTFLRDYPNRQISESWDRESEYFWNEEHGFMDMRNDKKRKFVSEAERFIRSRRLR